MWKRIEREWVKDEHTMENGRYDSSYFNYRSSFTNQFRKDYAMSIQDKTFVKSLRQNHPSESIREIVRQVKRVSDSMRKVFK